MTEWEQLNSLPADFSVTPEYLSILNSGFPLAIVVPLVVLTIYIIFLALGSRTKLCTTVSGTGAGQLFCTTVHVMLRVVHSKNGFRNFFSTRKQVL